MLDSAEKKKGGDSIDRKRELRKERRAERRYARRHRSPSDSSARKTPDTVRVTTIQDMNESFSQIIYDRPSRYKEKVTAENDYRVKYPNESYYISIGDNNDNLSIANVQYNFQDPYLFVSSPQTADFNFYKTELTFPSITEKPLQSPLAPASGLNYVFDYEYMFLENGKKYYCLKVKPVFPGDALYSGFIVVEDSTWALRSVDLSVNPGALLYCREFRIQQKYLQTSEGVSVPEETRVSYVIREGKKTIHGSTELQYRNYSLNRELPPRTFTTEVKEYAPDAFDKDSAWWATNRPFPLNENEIKHSRKIDSLSTSFNSDEYKFKSDSTFNRIDLWSILYKGIHVRSHKHQNMFYALPLAAQINPMGIGGYRHRLSGGFAQRFRNDFYLETEGMADYGVVNRDIRGKAGVGLTYIPKKFVRTFFRFGDYYDAINDNASISSVFSRSNYARTRMFSISQRMEVINGLFAELTFTHSDQQPIINMKMDNWSDDLFGSVNQPIDFERYIKSEFKLQLAYLFRQKYVMKKKRKILLGSRWPELNFTWRKGVPDLLGSEVNFDYLELGFKYNQKVSRWGQLNTSFLAGNFINKSSLRLLEHKYFRGSDKVFFSSPLNSFQLLGPTLTSSSAFLRACAIHHFEGSLTNKIPLLNRLRISFAAGGGLLLMEENNFRHAEFYGGPERVFRIRRQLFRIGLYAVTSDNNFSKAAFTWKIGISSYENNSRKWSY